METFERDNRTAHHLGQVSQRNGRGLAANTQAERDRGTLDRANPKNSNRHLASAQDRRNSKSLHQRKGQFVGTRRRVTRAIRRSLLAGRLQPQRSQSFLEAVGSLAPKNPGTAAARERSGASRAR